MSDYFARKPEESSIQTTPPAEVVAQPDSHDLPERQTSLSPVLTKDVEPPPPAVSRWLHGGPPLSDLAALASKASSGKKEATSWRAFTDEEDERIESTWQKLQQRKASKGKDKVTDEDDDEMAWTVPVGLDGLFSVHLAEKPAVLKPDFWQLTGSDVRVMNATWFYVTSSSTKDKPTHMRKIYPVDAALAQSLEKAYAEIRPFDEHYAAEVKSALQAGADAETKLRVSLDKKTDAIFQNGSEARLYSAGVMSTIGKSFLSTEKSFGGGQLVVRGWDAFKAYRRSSQPTQAKAGKPASIRSVEGDEQPPAESPTTATFKQGSSLLSSLKAKLGIAEAANPDAESEEKAASMETADAMTELRQRKEGEDENTPGTVGDVDELVLVVHGIGQQLAGQYSSFDFVHAVNAFRKACTDLSTSEQVAPLLHKKRAQFIPVKWRTDLSFDEVGGTDDAADEKLDNRFSLDDITIKESVPLLRQVVSGLVLDVPFYLSHHREKMVNSVVKEANRIYKLFCARNPSFAEKGKVSIIAHSLGSAICSDILSVQPTHVKPFGELTPDELASEDSKHFLFDTRVLFCVGSPLAFFLHLGRGQLIARKGRERTQNVGRDIALDRAGRNGCMAIDTIYSVYHQTDPVAFALNATVDAEYSKMIKPIAIPSNNQTLLSNIGERMTHLFNFSTLWGASGKAEADVNAASQKEGATDNGDAAAIEAAAAAKMKAKAQAEETNEKDKEKAKGIPMPAPTPPRVRRPTQKRMPSERPGHSAEAYERIARAEKRFKALNPYGCIDFYLPAEGMMGQYLDAITSHGSYWFDPRFATFVLTSLFCSEEDLELTGREEIGEEA